MMAAIDRTLSLRAFATPILFGAIVAASSPVHSQTTPQPLSATESRTLNFAFASRLGSGVYDISGRTIQVYRLPFDFDFREEGERAWGVRGTLQATVGFFDFRTSDVAETGLPDDVDTFGLTPGVELRVPRGPRWLLKPYAEAGYGQESDGETDSWLYSAGLRSFAEFGPGAFRLVLGNDLFWARVDPEDGPDDDFAALQTSFEALHGIGAAIAGAELEVGPYAVVDLSFDSPGFPFPRGDGNVDGQYEVGFSFGTAEPVRWKKLSMPRLGVGYRFGPDLSAWRFVIGIPVSSLRR